MDVPFLSIGQSRGVKVDDACGDGCGRRTPAIGGGGVAGRQEFAGYWEYVLDDAIFTAPSHPNWGGTAMIGSKGGLLGIGSLQLEQGQTKSKGGHLDLVVPIDRCRRPLTT